MAISDTGPDQHTILLQCKHTQQPDAKCGESAIEEVLRSIPSYEDAIQGDARPMVVTNAAGFTRAAELLARQRAVRLIARDDLPQLRTLYNPRSWEHS